ncbi:acyl carrier protein [Gelidibacter japonicus]|uniref:acyl carrier protein n=1 Tax=Gelidibacter japonicus TaxID=1962232 RepID=UPI002AFDF6C0|nr:acyl carrier protein [Gelidibacter japonicus]
MKEQLIAIVKEALELENENVSLTDHLSSYESWDSLGRLSLMALIDESFDIQLSDEEFNSFETIEDLHKALVAKKQ